MGAKISKEPIEPVISGVAGTRSGDYQFTVNTVSQSRFFCYVQQSALWPDYYVIYDMRSEADYNKSHIVSAKPKWKTEDGTSWAWDMIVLLYGYSSAHPTIIELLDSLQREENPPSAVYILDGPAKQFMKRYKMIMSDSDPKPSLPGPFELLPPTPTNRGIYAIHRVHFVRSRSILAALKLDYILNISDRRLFGRNSNVKIDNIMLQDVPEKDSAPIQDFLTLASAKVKSKGRGNILIIDEPGNEYGALLAGYFAVTKLNRTLDEVCETLNSRIGFLDPWYITTLTDWVGN